MCYMSHDPICLLYQLMYVRSAACAGAAPTFAALHPAVGIERFARAIQNHACPVCEPIKTPLGYPTRMTNVADHLL